MIKPQGTNILIKTFEIANSTASGIVLSTRSTSGKNPIEEKGEVLAIGEGVTKTKVGDVVYFKEYNIDRVEIGSFSQPETLVFLDEKYVVAIDD